MYRHNGYVPTYVLTKDGIKEIRDVNITDRLIEYKSGNLLEVVGIQDIPSSDIWDIKYSDGRIQKYNITSDIFTGIKIMPLIMALKRHGSDFSHIAQYEVDLYSHPTGKLEPDPYIAGALIIYGEYGGEYINLPADKEAVDNLFAHKYNLNYADKLGDDRLYFSWNGSHGSNPITWKEFFKGYSFYAKDLDSDLPIIPKEYIFASSRDRWHFIQGVFDIGFDRNDFKDTVAISHKYEDRLHEIQWILWSLGIASTVTYDPKLPNTKGRIYRLDIQTPLERCPHFFYEIFNIERQFTADRKNFYRDAPFEVKVIECKDSGTGWSYNPIFKDPKKLYLDSNFLPRVSS